MCIRVGAQLFDTFIRVSPNHLNLPLTSLRAIKEEYITNLHSAPLHTQENVHVVFPCVCTCNVCICTKVLVAYLYPVDQLFQAFDTQHVSAILFVVTPCFLGFSHQLTVCDISRPRLCRGSTQGLSVGDLYVRRWLWSTMCSKYLPSCPLKSV